MYTRICIYTYIYIYIYIVHDNVGAPPQARRRDPAAQGRARPLEAGRGGAPPA